ncbi:TPA: hypothetical protein ACGW3M_000977 [Pseudomonas aeruginosa]|nr:hypothetical protein [Pseudomonas aeruginosa]ELJ2276205.1 hypothetical protein [Pseudomonas aeruginosa]
MKLTRKALLRILTTLRILIDKGRTGWGLIESTSGRFIVRYSNGQQSRPFYYKTARDYADVFGGRVIHIATGRVL